MRLKALPKQIIHPFLDTRASPLKIIQIIFFLFHSFFLGQIDKNFLIKLKRNLKSDRQATSGAYGSNKVAEFNIMAIKKLEGTLNGLN